ncbi:xanthine dehydrogenase/oxidase-like [Lineus longissimus]|uniref:xanthine dehydrogenase/oxidase-like n=1 Tax=Lineus longissimus TaxID=88925 RepID=UPI00315C5E19
MACSHLVFFLNGKKVTEENIDPETTLVEYLRNNAGLRGTKVGCGAGGCGACTVMVSTYERGTKKIRHYAAVSCILPLVTLHNKAVTTVEGVGSIKTKLHPVQERIAKCHGVQCGFCTPGMVMSMYTLLRNNPEPSLEDIQTAMQGNLCRCTGYRPILQANSTFAKDACCWKGSACCRNNGPKENLVVSPTFDDKDSAFLPYDATQEAIFPSELQLVTKEEVDCLMFRGKRTTFYLPSTLAKVAELMRQYPKAKLISGGTILSQELRSGSIPVLIGLDRIQDLTQVRVTDKGVDLGAGLSLYQVQQELEKVAAKLPVEKTRTIRGIAGILHKVASGQVRNIGTIGGNLGSGESAYDIATFLMGVRCGVTLIHSRSNTLTKCRNDGMTELPVDEHYHDKLMSSLAQGAVIASIHVPFSTEDQRFYAYKHSKRSEFDWSVVSGGFGVEFVPETVTVKQMTLAFGNVRPETALAVHTCELAKGRTWGDALASDIIKSLGHEFQVTPGDELLTPIKRTLIPSLFQKFYLKVAADLNGRKDGVKSEIKLTQDHFCSTQVFEQVPEGQDVDDAVGRPVVHQAAFDVASGTAIYIDDIPSYVGELFMGLVLSKKAHAKIVKVDPCTALAIDGVVSYVDHRDVKGTNTCGGLVTDEEIFATEIVKAEGVVIGAIVAKSDKLAKEAARLVDVTYEELKPILTLEEAVAANPDMKPRNVLKVGDVEEGFKKSKHIIEGEFRLGGQEHFYMETNGSIAIPSGEKGEMDIIGGSQSLGHVHRAVAKCLGVECNKIKVRHKRIGGAFGGKESGADIAFLPCAIAADKLGQPVRCILTREEDMIGTRKRHPVLFKYKVGVDDEGRIIALHQDVFVDAGWSTDVSPMVTLSIVLLLDNCYKIPNNLVRGYTCFTNTNSNTAMRGYGAPQAIAGAENIITHIAQRLNIKQEKIREINMLYTGDVTVTDFKLDDCNIQKCYDQAKVMADYPKRLQEVEKFNSEHRYKKRGISVVPIKFSISLKPKFLQQAGALVHIYIDGSVLITHGGVEMGQGLHTKLIQVASRALEAPISRIHIAETSTDKCPNPVHTGGSQGTDMWGAAVMNACLELKSRLKPFKDAMPPSKGWEDWVKAAYFRSVYLSAIGFHRAVIGGAFDGAYDLKTNKGKICDYWCFGAACSEVEIDCLTGSHRVIETNIVMDVGRSINPAIDIGQAEGGFLMGLGYFMLEENLHHADGTLKSRDVGSYKIPSLNTIPMKFNVALLKEARNDLPQAVYSSKAIGEPPLLLASSVFCAAKEAISAARVQNGLSREFRLDGPASAERTRLNCGNLFCKGNISVKVQNGL